MVLLSYHHIHKQPQQYPTSYSFLPRVDNVEFILDLLQAFRCSCHYLTRSRYCQGNSHSVQRTFCLWTRTQLIIPCLVCLLFDKLNNSSSSLVLFLITTHNLLLYLCLMKPRLGLLMCCPSEVSSACTISNSQNIIKIWVLLTLHKAVWILLETLQSFL